MSNSILTTFVIEYIKQEFNIHSIDYRAIMKFVNIV